MGMLAGRKAGWACCSMHDKISHGSFRMKEKADIKKEIDEAEFTYDDYVSEYMASEWASDLREESDYSVASFLFIPMDGRGINVVLKDDRIKRDYEWIFEERD